MIKGVTRLRLALVAYVALGALAWMTITDARLRLASLLVLGLFAVKTIVRRKDVMHDGDEG